MHTECQWCYVHNVCKCHNDGKRNLNTLSACAGKLRVHKKVAELMEILLNG